MSTELIEIWKPIKNYERQDGKKKKLWNIRWEKMSDIEKRILLNQREIMYALRQILLEDNNIPTKILKVANGLGKACVLTNQVLESEKEDD